MTILNNERVIAIEEHYVDSNVMANVQGTDAAAAACAAAVEEGAALAPPLEGTGAPPPLPRLALQ